VEAESAEDAARTVAKRLDISEHTRWNGYGREPLRVCVYGPIPSECVEFGVSEALTVEVRDAE
jgi:hypothetical protein